MSKKKVLPLESLQFLAFNRNTKEAQIQKLGDSVAKHGILRDPVIAKTKLISGDLGYYIVDGQHLIKALIRAGHREVDCIIIEPKSLEDIVGTMAVLNNVVSRWTTGNFVDAYASLGISDYKTLRLYKHSYGISYNVAGELLGVAGQIKTGAFKVKKKDAEELMQYINDMCSYVGNHKAHFIIGFMRFYRQDPNNYDHKKFLKKAVNAKEQLNKDITIGSCVEMFNTINA